MRKQNMISNNVTSNQTENTQNVKGEKKLSKSSKCKNTKKQS